MVQQSSVLANAKEMLVIAADHRECEEHGRFIVGKVETVYPVRALHQGKYKRASDDCLVYPVETADFLPKQTGV